MSVAYQTSGSIAVSDEEALRFAEFADHYSQAVDDRPEEDSTNSKLHAKSKTAEGSLTIRKGSIQASLEGKLPGQVSKIFHTM